MRSSLTALLSPSPGFFDFHGYCLASSLLKNIPFDSASHSIFPLILNPKCHKKSPLFTVSSSVFYSPVHRSMDLAITPFFQPPPPSPPLHSHPHLHLLFHLYLLLLVVFLNRSTGMLLGTKYHTKEVFFQEFLFFTMRSEALSTLTFSLVLRL